MEERNYSNQQPENLITDIVLPTLFTILILFCLVQVGLAFWGNASDVVEMPEKATAISAFAS